MIDAGEAAVWIVVALGLAATVEDVWRRQISNWIPASALIAGLLCQSMAGGWRGAGTALAGAGAGFVVFLLFYVLGGMGGGDVKLMAGFGALLGWSRLWQAALWTAILGALLAVIVLAVHAARRKQATGRLSIPYAPAITAGVWLALIPG